MSDKEDWRHSIEVDLAAIEAQIEEIERAVGRRPGAPASPAAEIPDAPAATAEDRAPPPADTPPPSPATPRSALSLLEELREAATERAYRAAEDDSERKAREAQLNKRMRALFRYLTEFCRHLDTIRLPVPTTYWLNPQTPLGNLHWKDAFVDSRLASLNDTAPLVLVQVRYTLAADGVVVIGRDIAHSGVFQNELGAMDMNYAVRDQRSASGKLIAQDFLIDRQVRVTLSFTADYDTDTISLRTRNLTDFGTVDYQFHSAMLDDAFFEELGRQILGRPTRLLQELKADIRLRP